MCTRNDWSDIEVTALLDVIRERNVHILFDGKRYKNNEIYRLIEEEMKMRGHTTKSAEQIKNKWKSLKSLYATCKKQHVKSGAGRRECVYYDQLDEILGSRPSTSVEGLDSFNEAIPDAITVEVDPSIFYE
ncbi:hypothetical protein C0J52_03093 [Blattella germanica]|nr:hypothetical protein C0J52_03093 [Blattella germanica]